MKRLDLIICERNKVLSFFSITTDQRRELFENEYIQIYENIFRFPEAFCEWNEVVDIKTKTCRSHV